MLEFIRQQLENEFLSGGMMLLLMGSVVAIFRRVPRNLYRLLYRRFITYVDVDDSDDAFYWLQTWLAQHPYSKKTRLLTVSTKKSSYTGNEIVKSSNQSGKQEEEWRPEIYFSPSEGVHLLKVSDHWVLITRIRKEQAGGGGGNNSGTNGKFWREKFTFQTLVKDRAYLRDIIIEAQAVALPKGDHRISIYTFSYNNWVATTHRLPRNIESVVLEEGMMEKVTTEVKRFFMSAEWYQKLGIPYQMGYLFYGDPGSGKSSTAFVLASYFKRDIYLLKVSGISDDNFRCAMNNIPKHSIVLIEDVDCFFEGRERMVEGGGLSLEPEVSFSGFLNGLDGITGSEGRLLIMTTNHIEKLDTALIRDGRVDHKVEFKNATKSQAYQLFMRFFPGADDLAEAFAASVPDKIHSMAKLQGHLLKHRDDAVQASNFPAALAVAS